MRITKENTVALTIDIQERLVGVMHEQERLLRNCEILCKGLETLGIPQIVTQQYTQGLGDTVPVIKDAISNFEYIEKKDFSCWDVAEVKDKLQNLNAHNVIISGIESHVCVLQTAIDLKAAGLNPIVIVDCVSSRSAQNIELAKERFRHEGIMMSSYESILFELTRSATAPEFRTISKLVK